MIIIAGTGRSGTSFLAKLYVELGFNTAGGDVWWDETRAGVESKEVNRLLIEIMQDLLVPANSNKVAVYLFSLGKKIIGKNLLSRETRNRLKKTPLRDQLLVHDFDRFNAIVEKYRGRIIDLSQKYEVIKAPGFCRTLGVWVAAGAPIDHVIIPLRNLDDVMKSFDNAQELRFTQKSIARNHYSLILGYLMATVADYNLNVSIIKFPECLSAPENLYKQLRFPSPVQYEDFLLVYERVVRRKD